MHKLAAFGVFLTLMVWSGPLAACPSYMVLTCAARQATPEKPTIGWESRQVRIFNSDGDLAWKGRVETYNPTGKVRIYNKDGDLVDDFKILLPEYAQ